MRVGRHEILLIVGLILAVSVAFSGQTARLIEAMREFEGAYGLGLLPGLAIAAITLLVFIQGKRRQLQERAAIASHQAVEAQERARELERLVTFWQALTQSFDLDAIRDVVAHYLPELTGSGEAWIVIGAEGFWQNVLGDASVPFEGAPVPVTDVASESLDLSGIVARPDGIEHQGQICFPMIAAGTSLGVLGVPADAPSLTPARRLVIGAAAALLAVAVRSVQLLQQVRENSVRDTLTGCVNRGHAMEVISAELLRARRSHLPVSLIMFDIDRFKRINDRHGHLCGDAVLSEVGATMRAALRSSDLKCRFGGEEFLVLLPETPLEGAVHAAETLRRELAGLSVKWNETIVRITSSFGVASARPGELDPMPIIERADQALYRAKREGRDCVRVAAETSSLAVRTA